MVQIIKEQYLESRLLLKTNITFEIKLKFKYQLKAHKKYKYRIFINVTYLTCWQEKTPESIPEK